MALVTKEEPKPWINITVTGATAGVIVSALTYSATATTGSAAATTTGFAVDMAGEGLAYAATALFGGAAGVTVRIVSKGAAKSSEEAVRTSSLIGAAVVSAIAGAATALTITLGTRVVEYSIEYGGMITKEMAQKFSEMYLTYKASRSDFTETGDVGQLVDDDWVLLADKGGVELPLLTDGSA